MPDRQIGVLIDYENVGLGSVQSLFDQLSDIGRIIIKRAYADWSKGSSKRDQILELGIEAIHHFRAPRSGKNASDICLAIDAIELLYRSPVDTFVIVSSDTDFVPLVSTLRAAGKMVIGGGHRAVVAPTLVHSCDRYIFLDEGKPTAQDHSLLKNEAQVFAAPGYGLYPPMTPARYLAAKLHDTMRRMDPSFDLQGIWVTRTSPNSWQSSPEVKLHRPERTG